MIATASKDPTTFLLLPRLSRVLTVLWQVLWHFVLLVLSLAEKLVEVN